MKRRITHIISAWLVLALLASLLSVSAFAAGTGEFDPPDNLIVNPGFEDGIAGWTSHRSDGTWFPVTIIENNGLWPNISHSGKRAGVFPGFNFDHYLTQDIILPQSGIYTLSAYVRVHINQQDSEAFLMATDPESNALLRQGDGVTVGQEYHRLTLSFAGKKGSVARIALQGAGTFVVDDVCLRLSAGNLVTHSDFEDGLSNWSDAHATSAFTTDAMAHSGQSSLCISSFQSQPFSNYVEQSFLKAGQNYFVLTAWVNTPNDFSSSGGGAMLRIEARDKNGAVLKTADSTPIFHTNGAWQEIMMAFDAPAATDHVSVKIAAVNCIGAFYVDDIVLYHS